MAAILNGRTVYVTDAVALFPRFPHLVEAGRIELPLGVSTMCRDLFPVTPRYHIGSTYLPMYHGSSSRFGCHPSN